MLFNMLRLYGHVGAIPTYMESLLTRLSDIAKVYAHIESMLLQVLKWVHKIEMVYNKEEVAWALLVVLSKNYWLKALRCPKISLFVQK